MAEITHIIGIDFGTCQCSVAWFNPKSGHAELLRNAEGYEKTPSVVFYDKEKGEALVGSAAEFMLDDEESNRDVKVGIKHDIGKDMLIHLGGKDRRPTEIAADILRKLKRDAEQLHFKAPVTAAVIAHPAAFDASERERLAEAANLAGFERVILLSEPEAAAIAVTKAGVKVGNNLVVYDLGAGTFDLTVLLQTGDGNYRLPIGSRGKRCGGDDFDRALYEHCDAMVRQQHGRGVAADGQVDPQFMRACRQRKENLSLSHRNWVDFSSVLRGDPPVVFKHRVDPQPAVHLSAEPVVAQAEVEEVAEPKAGVEYAKRLDQLAGDHVLARGADEQGAAEFAFLGGPTERAGFVVNLDEHGSALGGRPSGTKDSGRTFVPQSRHCRR